MRLLILSAAIVLPASSAAAPPPHANKPQVTASAANPACTSANARLANSPPKPEMKRLDELPSANLSLAVMREVGGCNEPVVVRYGYGAASEAPRPPRAKIYR
jgi:hypothetical protein